jgi:CheY-like chemotaxis protein
VNRVLVVDDDPEIRLLYEEELSEDGYDIISSNGERGLLQLIAVKSPDVILLDVNLRSQSALDLLQRIRNAFRWIPVIVTTVCSPAHIDQELLGADSYVTKSSYLTKVKQQIAKCLGIQGPLNKTEMIVGTNVQTMAMKPAVQLRMSFRWRPE